MLRIIKQAHMTEIKITDPGKKEPRRKLSFWIWMAVVWLWPLVVLLTTSHWYLPVEGWMLLGKSTWVLFAGVVQGWLVILLTDREDQGPDLWVVAWIILTIASHFLLPFGLARWEFSFEHRIYWINSSWDYWDNFFLSFFIHMIPITLVAWLGVYDVDERKDILFFGGSYAPPASSYGSSYSPSSPSGSGLWGKKSWLDDVWSGGQISDDYYGHRGEFDLNDEARCVSEDMQQFHNAYPDADLTDHYYWDDVCDAETDGYLDS